MLKPREIKNPKDAISEHQLIAPVEQLTGRTADRSSLVLSSTSLSEIVGAEDGLVSGKLQSSTVSSFSSSTHSISTRSRSSPVDFLMHQQQIQQMDMLYRIENLEKHVAFLTLSQSSSPSASGVLSTDERVTAHGHHDHRRSVSFGGAPTENLVSRKKKNSLDHHITRKQVTRDGSLKMVSCSYSYNYNQNINATIATV